MELIFSENTGFYYYIVLLTINISILIYFLSASSKKSQYAQDEINVIRSFFHKGNEMIRGFGEDFSEKDYKQKEEYIKENKINNTENRLLRKWFGHEQSINKIEQGVILPRNFLMIVIVVNLVVILYSNTLHSSYPKFEIYPAIFFLIIEIIVLLVVVR